MPPVFSVGSTLTGGRLEGKRERVLGVSRPVLQRAVNSEINLQL